MPAVDDRATIGAAIGAIGADAGALVRVLSLRHWCATRPATSIDAGPCVLSTYHSCRCGCGCCCYCCCYWLTCNTTAFVALPRKRCNNNILVIQNLNEISLSRKIQEREKRLTSSDRTYCLSSKKR